MIKRLLLFVFALLSVCYADNWTSINGSEIQTTIGYGKAGAQYICEWIKNPDYDGLTINVKSATPLNIGKYRTSCLLLGDYVFCATMYDGYGDNSVLVRVRGRKLKELLNGETCDAVIMVAGYQIRTTINTEIGEFKENKL